ncbi:MAG: type II toxin-antitoxin system Phd/YefM family antitoxin [Armatimonadota bacterium]
MKVTVVELRTRTAEVIKALERNERVTILYRGKPKGVIHPAQEERRQRPSIADLPAFGMWKDREDMKDPVAWVRKMRSARRKRLYGL